MRITTTGAHEWNNRTSIVIGATPSIWSVTTVTSGRTKLFMTPTTYTGNLAGLAGADGICQTEATNRGYAGTWKALISSSTVNAKDRVTLVYPVVRADNGNVIAATNLWSGSIATSTASVSTHVWTGTTSAGLKTGLGSCSVWTSISGNENYGTGLSTDYGWTAYTNAGCNVSRALYCVKQ